ncbi:hypothetical protein BOTCAL_0689g00020 [Botryotinia calthae]|uniref:RRM domain-containing protein n=1 Tax=Botryotinia calthae TaxID=38488 RepID=A0A4Y8CH70_9HELO|nr:hypothetical protein BOTCAL_0689g00020 [Botryotinia calthae]
MSYPPPPGIKSTPSPHPSLPARPPPSTNPQAGFKPAFSNNNNGPSRPPASGGYGGFAGFAPRSVAAPVQPGHQGFQQPPAAYQQPQPYNPYSGAPQQEAAYGAAPQIRNPFAPPTASAGRGMGGYDEDPEMAAQIAQWQSAYAGKDANATSTSNNGYTGAVRKYPTPGESSTSASNANATPLGRTETGPSMTSQAITNAAHNDTGVAAIVSDSKTNQKTVVRTGGGSQWTDSSLLEWDPSHFRLFVGNLAGEVTDESLHKAFSRWTSLQKARVIRDKRTTKSKGYGFVSFSDGDDFFQAARDMQGKYIGSHPVLLRRSTTEIKAVTPKDNKHGKNNKNKGKGGNRNDGGQGNKDRTGAGIQKAGSKTKGGLKVLG